MLGCRRQGFSRNRFSKWMRSVPVVLALAVALPSCAGPDYYQLYQSEHPTWEPRFPRESISIDELLAVVHAPATASRSSW